MFYYSNNESNSEKAKRRIELAKTDLTYKKYPITNILTGEFKGHSKLWKNTQSKKKD